MRRAVVPIDKIELTESKSIWRLAIDRAEEIEAYWRVRTTAQPTLFNGGVLLLDNRLIRDKSFRGEFFKTDYKSFLWWREHDRPDRNAFDFLGAAALHSCENSPMLGCMSRHTSSPGMIYMPSGSPHLADVVDAKLDIDRSLLRETAEETGIRIDPDNLEPPLVIFDGARIVYVRATRIAQPADIIVRQVSYFLSDQKEAELEKLFL